MSWIAYSLACLTLWGLWGFLLKIAYRSLSWIEVYFLNTMSSFLVALTVFALSRGAIKQLSSAYLPVLAGLFSSIGFLFFNKALEGGNAAIVIPLTALYPAVTIVLAIVFLNESVTTHQIVGMALAVLAILFLSIE